jgi:hypothetical protein
MFFLFSSSSFFLVQSNGAPFPYVAIKQRLSAPSFTAQIKHIYIGPTHKALRNKRTLDLACRRSELLGYGQGSA